MQINSAYPAMASSLAASHQAMQCGLWSISRIYPLPFFSSNSFRYIASALEKFVHLSSISGGKMLGAVKKVPQQGSQCLKALATKN